MANRKITVNGEEYEIDLDEELEVRDVSEGQKRIAAQMGFWGTIWAEAEGEKLRTDTFYRRWRAGVAVSILESDKKSSDWKVKARIESDEQFSVLKEAMARAITNATFARGIFEAFRVKGNQLQSKGAMQRAELDVTGMHTPDKEPKKRQRRARKSVEPKATVLPNESTEDLKEHMRKNIFNKKKK